MWRTNQEHTTTQETRKMQHHRETQEIQGVPQTTAGEDARCQKDKD